VSGPEIVIGADPAACSILAADRIASVLGSAVTDRGRADWATTGGSSAIGLYRRLVDDEMAGAVPWPNVHVWWGDDRFVPRDHPLSNVKAFDDILLGAGQAEEGTAGGPAGVAIPVDQIHPFPTGAAIGRSLGAAWCAAALASTLRDSGLESVDGWPVFDLLLLGIGRDGHLLSVFAGSSAFDSTELGLAIPAPTHIEPHVERVTLNPAVIAAARSVLVVATGTDKASVVADILEGERDPRELPARLAARDGATWILDEAAAARLSR
jgi:6-phosphogluconolactonase